MMRADFRGTSALHLGGDDHPAEAWIRGTNRE
jgi:hypothetical protein